MGDGTGHSRYVKLTKDQVPIEDIKTGAFNQPIEVPQLNVRKCNECGQALPESFEPPADEPWTTGIFGCYEDRDSCLVRQSLQKNYHLKEHREMKGAFPENSVSPMTIANPPPSSRDEV
uniref:Uncharacterized protein n=1 Tax=Cannabis sativa TaxID=3483 RepID=A0A803NU49_CANSA